MAIAKEAQYWIDYLPQEGGGGGRIPTMDYTGWLRPTGVLFSGFRHFSLVEVYESIRKSIISVLRKAQKG